jgi:hypothetical protein
MTALDFFARYRVRLGYLLAAIVLWLARPTPGSIRLGAVVGVIGLCIRAYAAGYLHKQEVLTVTGPYGHTRNPLYFGSSFLAAGVALATHSWWAAGLIVLYFALVYSFVMRREEMELRRRHGAAFDAYAAAVPLFFPRFAGAAVQVAASGNFSWQQYRKNHEHQAAIGFVLLLAALVAIWRLRLP